MGRINAPWGLRGHVKVTPLTSNPDRFRVGATVTVKGRPVRILDIETPQGFPCVRLEGYPDRTAVESLRGELIEISANDLGTLPDDEFYIHDLVGMTVVTTAGDEVGRLIDVLTTGANDVYLVRRPEGREVLIPALNSIVVQVDVAAKRMVIDPVKGLLD